MTFSSGLPPRTLQATIGTAPQFLPGDANEVRSAVEAVSGASVAHDNGDGRMEDGPDYAISDSIRQVHQIPQVMTTTLSCE
ncbi:MAG: hypothetical protein FWH56_02980 [Betaproteobacteria bacterium]|nr:hypothetical protein [Betaproteobacteria bacterium]